MKKHATLSLLLAVLLCLSACGKPAEPDYTVIYHADDYIAGALEYTEVSRKEAAPDMTLKELYVDPEAMCHGYVIFTLQSDRELHFTLSVESRRSDGTVSTGDKMQIDLSPNTPYLADLYYNGWDTGDYDVILRTEGLESEQTILIHMPY